MDAYLFRRRMAAALWAFAGVAAAGGAAAGAAAAQTPTPAVSKPDPLDPGARVPGVVYESAFSRYRRTADDKATTWREANENVTRIGGWRTYARQEQLPVPAEPVPHVHGGHKTP